MSPVVAAVAGLDSAEAIFAHFGVAFDAALVRVGRLHMLQSFHDALAAERWLADLPDGEARARCRELLERAHREFASAAPGAAKRLAAARGVRQAIPVGAIGRPARRPRAS